MLLWLVNEYALDKIPHERATKLACQKSVFSEQNEINESDTAVSQNNWVFEKYPENEVVSATFELQYSSALAHLTTGNILEPDKDSAQNISALQIVSLIF